MGTALGAGPSLAPLLIGLGRLLDGHIHGLLLCLQTPLKLLVDMVVGGLLKEEILYLLPELGVGGKHLVKVDSDLRGGCASNQVQICFGLGGPGRTSGSCCYPLSASSAQPSPAIMMCLLHPFGG